MRLILFIVLFVSSFSCQQVVKQQVCNETLAFCSPRPNETWYYHNYYQFIVNKNNTDLINNNVSFFNIHFVTLSTTNSSASNRKIKSWYNLTSSANGNMTFQITDDWFPSPIINTTNITWVTELALTFTNTISDKPTNTSDPKSTNSVLFYVVQSSTKNTTNTTNTTNIVSYESHSFAPWMIAIIVIGCMLVILLLSCIIYFYQKKNKKAILSTPDAVMIADTFRQVMTSDQIGDDILKRQLKSEGTSISEVERRTSSTRKKSKNKPVLPKVNEME